mgnify:CR=1 FL=1
MEQIRKFKEKYWAHTDTQEYTRRILQLEKSLRRRLFLSAESRKYRVLADGQKFELYALRLDKPRAFGRVDSSLQGRRTRRELNRFDVAAYENDDFGGCRLGGFRKNKKGLVKISVRRDMLDAAESFTVGAAGLRLESGEEIYNYETITA